MLALRRQVYLVGAADLEAGIAPTQLSCSCIAGKMAAEVAFDRAIGMAGP
jgi:hypothetical protein